MASTYSPNLQITLMATGDQAGNWGNTTNTNLGTLIEQAISGGVSVSCSGGTTDIGSMTSGADAVPRNMYLTLTGTGGGTVTCPTNSKLYFVYNSTSAAITFKTVAGTGISIPASATYALYCNGTNVVNAVSANSITGVSPANPTAVLGLTAVNGSAITFMRSDAAPALDVSIVPTWTGAHTWSSTTTFNGTLAGTAIPTYLTTYLASPAAIGGTTAAAGTFTTLVAKKAYTVPVALGTAGVITTSCAPDCSQSNVFYCTATNGTAFTVAPTNPSDGQTINIFITQPASGTAATWTATWAKWPGGSTNGVLSTTLGAIDLVVATYRNSTWYATLSKAFA
jgi:hypothetical protein